jgi:hypothetical protein
MSEYDTATVRLIKRPWCPDSSQKLSVLMMPKVVSRPEVAKDHESSLRSDWGTVVLCNYLKSWFWTSPHEILNLYGRFCPYRPPYKFGVHTAEKCALPPGPLVLELACLAPDRGIKTGKPYSAGHRVGGIFISYMYSGWGVRIRFELRR